ncbi:hypothetical protein SESBI_31256, partial [Sesbania bispinosa]
REREEIREIHITNKDWQSREKDANLGSVISQKPQHGHVRGRIIYTPTLTHGLYANLPSSPSFFIVCI